MKRGTFTETMITFEKAASQHRLRLFEGLRPASLWDISASFQLRMLRCAEPALRPSRI